MGCEYSPGGYFSSMILDDRILSEMSSRIVALPRSSEPPGSNAALSPERSGTAAPAHICEPPVYPLPDLSSPTRDSLLEYVQRRERRLHQVQALCRSHATTEHDLLLAASSQIEPEDVPFTSFRDLRCMILQAPRPPGRPTR